MWYKRLVNYYVFILSILTVNLISDRITGALFGLRFMTNPLRATVIGMCVLVFVLYPAYHYLDSWSERTALRIFKIGKNAGGKFIGVTLAFLGCLFILFLLYMQFWFGFDEVVVFVKVLGKKVLGYLNEL